MLRVLLVTGACWLAASAPRAALAGQDSGDLRSAVILSKTYTIDRKYKSMEGPSSMEEVRLGSARPPELLWITGFRTEIVGADGSTPMPREFMCHINLDIDSSDHKRRFGWAKDGSPRLFTLSQGDFSVEFPPGFGLPVMSDEPLSLVTQVLNHNREGGPYEVRHKVTIDFVRDRDIRRPLKPLFVTTAFGMALLEGKDGLFGVGQASEEQRASSCLPGLHAPNGTTTGIFRDGFGRAFSGHWVVKPGREVRRTLVSKLMNIPFDTTLHHVGVHLHPFAESVELRDITAGRTVFKSRARAPDRGIGLEHVDTFSSKKGIRLFKDHDYELVSRYDNTMGVDQDSMASMFLYLLDREFKPDSGLSGRAVPAEAFRPPEGYELETLHRETRQACPSRRLECYEARLRELTERHGPRAALEVFGRLQAGGEMESATDGHHVAHHVGHHTAMRFGPTAEAFVLCPHSYNDGCVHGFFQHALGMGDSTLGQAAAICEGLEANPAMSPKDRFYCYHGLGHGVLMKERYDLRAALKSCDSLGAPWAQAGCWQGVFMENNNAGQAEDFGKTLFLSTDPLAPCTQVEEKYRSECFINHSGRLMSFFQLDIEKAAEACLQALPPWVETCMASLGLMSSSPDWQPNFLRDARSRPLVDNAWAICRKFPQGHVATCVHAAVDNLANFDNPDIAREVAFCDVVERRYREGCLQRIGHNLRSMSPEGPGVQEVCESMKPSDRPLCLAGAGL